MQAAPSVSGHLALAIISAILFIKTASIAQVATPQITNAPKKWFAGPVVTSHGQTLIFGLIGATGPELWKADLIKGSFTKLTDYDPGVGEEKSGGFGNTYQISVCPNSDHILYTIRRINEPPVTYLYDVRRKTHRRLFPPGYHYSGVFVPGSETYVVGIGEKGLQEHVRIVELNLITGEQRQIMRMNDAGAWNLQDIRRGSQRVLAFSPSFLITLFIKIDPAEGPNKQAWIMNHKRDLDSGMSFNISLDGLSIANGDGLWQFDAITAVSALARAMRENQALEPVHRANRPRRLVELHGLIYDFRGWSPSGEYAVFQGRYARRTKPAPGELQIEWRVTKKDEQGREVELKATDAIIVYDRTGNVVYRINRSETAPEDDPVQTTWLDDTHLLAYEVASRRFVKINIRTGAKTIVDLLR